MSLFHVYQKSITKPKQQYILIHQRNKQCGGRFYKQVDETHRAYLVFLARILRE